MTRVGGYNDRSKGWEAANGPAYGWVVLERGWVRISAVHNDWESQETPVLRESLGSRKDWNVVLQQRVSMDEGEHME